MANKVSSTWKILSEISGVKETLFFLGSLINGFVSLANSKNGNWWWLVFSISLAAVALTVFFFGKRYQSAARKQRTTAEIERISNKPHEDLAKVLPSSAEFKRWGATVEDELRQWSKDAIIRGTHMQLRVRDSVWLDLSFHYHSNSKGISGAVWLNNSGIRPPGTVNFLKKDMTDSERRLYGDKSESLRPFYDFRDWRKATLEAYEQVKDRLADTYEVDVEYFTYHEGLTITFKHNVGEVSTEIGFVYVNRKLKRI